MTKYSYIKLKLIKNIKLNSLPYHDNGIRFDCLLKSIKKSMRNEIIKSMMIELALTLNLKLRNDIFTKNTCD